MSNSTNSAADEVANKFIDEIAVLAPYTRVTKEAKRKLVILIKSERQKAYKSGVASIKGTFEEAEMRGRLSERKAVALDSYWGQTFSEHTNYKGKFEKFVSNNDKRIQHLDSQIKGQADGE